MKWLGWLAPALFLTVAFPARAVENICPYTGQNQERIAQIMRIDYNDVPKLAARFCANVGRKAYNALGPDRVRKTYLGPIAGVIWVVSGDVVSPPGAPMQMAPISGFMYIIGPGGISDLSFLRWAAEIVGR
ncbi:MAG TPA: hypothetical protein VI732_06195 [Alphaproteobacteria bacterium]|nr:hypothetical protein [Alphaproteobacteria bacterium]